MDKRAIARITAGGSRGTGFLVSRDGLVLTALHVVADLEASRRNQRLVPYAGPIALRFGDPLFGTWPGGVGTVVAGLYSLQCDWAVVQVTGAVPDGVTPIGLADLATAHDTTTWKTFGFPEAAAFDGNDFDGRFTSWDGGVARLRSGAATGVRMAGISGSPCVVGGDAVALIDSALLDDNGVCLGGALTAIRTRAIAAAAAGRLPYSQPVDVPFERQVRSRLPQDPDALREAAALLGIPDRPFHVDVARRVILGGVAAAADALYVMAVLPSVRHEIYDMVAAAQLHHEAVDCLVEAAHDHTPGVLQASAEETCRWYALRARHKLVSAGTAVPGKASQWGNRLLHIDVAGHEESSPPAAGGDPTKAAADHLIGLIRDKASKQWSPARIVNDALAGKPGAPFCVALHNEHRVAVVEELRARLPNAHFLMVCPDEVVVTEAERTKVKTIAPHLDDEEELLRAYDTARTAD